MKTRVRLPTGVTRRTSRDVSYNQMQFKQVNKAINTHKTSEKNI